MNDCGGGLYQQERLKRYKKIKLIQKCVPFVIVSKVIQRPAVFAGPILGPGPYV